MAGFIQDPIQFINLIADNLRDRYQSGFPVLKELLQNTDDSEATDLHFGRSPGLPDADHVLLHGPALFFINNGRFSPSDAVGIRSFGQNSKAADEASIGKFGLGMKSVFHFCEAFFFLAHDGERRYAEVLNPWSGPESVQSLHGDWDRFRETDAQEIREHLATVTGKTASDPERLFILWLPLRRKAHLNLGDGSRAGAIVSEYPGDDQTLLDFLEDEGLPVRLAALMPMLRHLSNASFWDLRGKNRVSGPTFEVRLGDGAKRLSLLRSSSVSISAMGSIPSPRPVTGRIRVVRGTTSPLSLGFSGLETYHWNRALEAMHEHELWPSSYVRDSKGRSSEVKDKAQPHGTAFFARSPGSGKLITNWSVFLPLDDVKAVETTSCDSDQDFRLTLHGYFFVDAGRQKVHGLDDCQGQDPSPLDSEDSLRRAWNCELIRSTVLPLVLPALDAFCADERLSENAKTALTEALKHTSSIARFHEPITERNSWLREMTRDGAAWVLRSEQTPVLKMPDPPDKDRARPWRLFPALRLIAEQNCLAIVDAPNLLNPSVDTQWQENQLTKLLSSVDAKTLFADAGLLDYLGSFLAEAAGPYRATQSVRRVLTDLVREGLTANGEEVLRRNETRVRRVVEYLGLSACFKVVNDLPASLLRGLLSAETEILPMPTRFFPQGVVGDAALTVSDASLLLKEVEEALDEAGDSDQDLQNAALKLSEQLIKGVPAQHRFELLQSCADLRILGGFDCKKCRRVPISVRDIREATEAGILFRSAEGTTERARSMLAIDLQNVLSRERVLVINKETVSVALDVEGDVHSCDQHAVLRCLGMKPRTLGGVEERAALATLAHAPSNDAEIRGLRFLLHADPEHFNDDDTLWVLGRKQAPVWQKLWTLLVDGEKAPWNLVDSSVAEALSRREWDAVDIHEISAQAVLDEIERRDTSALDSSAFDRDECEQILKEVRDSDDALWCALPFHWTRGELPVSGAEDTAYLDLETVSMPDEMLHGVHLILLSDDGALRERQKRSLKPLDEQATIRIGLDQANASDRWLVILDALCALEQQGKALSPELSATITKSKWLPITGGEAVKPEDVIDLDAAEEEIDRLLAREPGAFITPRNLSSAIAGHPYFQKLRETHFSRGKEGLAQLGAALETLDEYQIGDVRFDDPEALAESAQVLGGSSNAGWQLLSTLIGKVGAEDCFKELVPGMTGAIPLDPLVDLLNWITERGGDESRSIRVHTRYLKVFAREETAPSVLGRLKLLNQESRWSPSSELVSGVTGIAFQHVLDSNHAQILAGTIFQDQPSGDGVGNIIPVAYASETSSAGPILRDYFDPWSARVASQILGVFVLLFGGDKSVKTLCEDLLGQHSRDWLISRIPWEIPSSDPATLEKVWLHGFTLERALDHFRMAVRLNDGETVSVRSILGKPVKVALDEQFKNLFVGRPSYFRLDQGDGYRVELVLRRISTVDCSDAQLSGYLQSSTSYLLREVFNQHRPDLGALWSELDRSDQVDIELAKALMLDNIPFYLKILGTHNHPVLRRGLESFRINERQEKEFGSNPQAERYRRSKEQALKELQQLIEKDEKAQGAILDSVQRKIRDFQYQPESVPFELFQNADDALRNLEIIDAFPAKPGDLDVEKLPAGVRQFVIEADENQITFMHWGRAINQFGSRGFPGRERGFDRDLENMLILSASDKDEDVTGKFGLGFKSVWLVTNQPTIVSGRLHAVIVGGLLPVTNHGETTQDLVSRLKARQPDKRWAGTAIHLPLRGDVSANVVLDRFCRVSGTMVAFSRSLRTITFQPSYGRPFSASWEPRTLPGIDAIEVGRIRQGDGDPMMAMKIQLADGALMLSLGPTGFLELPKEIPNLWVTAPIREQERLGFAINAMFEVDAGRSRLSAEVERNLELAKRLGNQFAAELERLAATVSDRWPEISASMEFAADAAPYSFWYSLWRTLMSRLPLLEKESGSRVLATTLLAKGFRDVAEAREIVPNALPLGLQRLIRATEAKSVLRGALSDTNVLGAVAKAPCFRSLLEIDTAVSSDVATWLRLLIPTFSQRTDRLQSITLAQLILKLDRRSAISPNDAQILGRALRSETREAWEKAVTEVGQDIVKDFKTAAENAGDLSFHCADRSVKHCKQLLSDRGSEDEKRRWAFSPDDARLSDQYGGEGSAFFLWCRDKLEAPTDKLKEWVIKAADPGRQKAALRYLTEGELARQVVVALHDTGFSGSWLATVDEQSDLISDWDLDSRWRLVYQILKTPEESRSAFQTGGRGPEEYEPEPINPETALEQIYEWWLQERRERLQRYCRDTYPEGRSPVLKDDDAGDIDRSSWLLVLLLGGFHTMGRVLPGQHRNFIEECQRRGWWKVFTDPDPVGRFEDWMGVLDQYIDEQADQQDYEQWMMRFPIIYKLSRYLDDYSDLLLQLKYLRERFDLAEKLTPLADPDQQGGGIGAAALPRTLGIGANFVIRELIRLGVIDSPHLRAHAFVPYRRVVQLVAEMGCPEAGMMEPRLRVSPVISDFLHEHMDAEKASFCGDFDIPLKIVAEDLALQEDLLGRRLSLDPLDQPAQS